MQAKSRQRRIVGLDAEKPRRRRPRMESACAPPPEKPHADRYSVYFLFAFGRGSTAGGATVLAIFSARRLARRPLVSQPGAMARISPPLPIRKFVGIVLVWNTFQASPLESTP